MIVFKKHFVKDTATKAKARVTYSLDNRCDKKLCVTIYARQSEKLEPIFGILTENNSDMMTDYFENDRVTLFEDHPLYKEARTQVENFESLYKSTAHGRYRMKICAGCGKKKKTFVPYDVIALTKFFCSPCWAKADPALNQGGTHEHKNA